MGKVYDAIDERLAEWIRAQRVFLVATAPRADDGLLNCSPRGLESLAYQVRTRWPGSTPPAAMSRRSPTCARTAASSRWSAPSRGRLATRRIVRKVIRIECRRIPDSCGYGVPRTAYQGERGQLGAWARRKGPGGLRAYGTEKNAGSLEGLRALRSDL